MHPILGFSRSNYYSYMEIPWKVDFKNPISDIFQGKISTSYMCTGEVDGDKIDLALEAHAIKYADDHKNNDNNNTIQKDYASVVCYAQKKNTGPWSKIDNINIEICLLQIRLQGLSKKLLRGYGGSSALVEGVDVEGTVVNNLDEPGTYFFYPYQVSEFKDEPLSSLSKANSLKVYTFDDSESGEPAKKFLKSLPIEEALQQYYKHHTPEEAKNTVAFNRIVSSYRYKTTELDSLLFQKYGGKKFSEFQQPFIEERTIRGYQRYFMSSLNPEDLYEGKISDIEYLNLAMASSSYSLIKGSFKDFMLPPDYTDYSTLIVLESCNYFSPTIAVIDAGSVETRNKLLHTLAPICIRQLSEELTELISCGKANCADIQNLMRHTKPSFFGRGDEKIYDEAVRKGRELLPHQLNIEAYNFEPMLMKIKKTLFPKALEIRLKFSKAAFYDAGGHFDVHRDTVRNKYHQGTLLVEVVSLHAGGDLVLEMNDDKYRWSLENRDSHYKITEEDGKESNHKDNENNLQKEDNTEKSDNMDEEGDGEDNDSEHLHERIRNVKFIAFYTDTNHQVEPVTSGARAVLQFDIYALYKDVKEDDSDIKGVPDRSKVHLSITQKEVEEFDEEQEEEQEEMRDASKSFFQNAQSYDLTNVTDRMTSELIRLLSEQVRDDKAIAFSLLHMYTDTQVLIQSLKEGDRQIFQACLHAGYCVQIVPIIIEARSNIQGSFKNFEGEYYIRKIPSVLTVVDIGFVLNDDDITNVQTVNMVEPRSRLKSGKVYPSVTYAATGFEQIEILNSKPAVAWAGNEPAPAEHKYFSVACVITTRNAIRTAADEDIQPEEEEEEEEDEEENENDVVAEGNYISEANAGKGGNQKRKKMRMM
jgi:hypothetical protein